jgi:hypothetical protein
VILGRTPLLTANLSDSYMGALRALIREIAASGGGKAGHIQCRRTSARVRAQSGRAIVADGS